MGVTGPTVTLVDATPYRLRYLVDRVSRANPIVIIPNGGGASPDLWTDALSAAGQAGSLPLLARALNQAVATGGTGQGEARKVLLEDDTSATPAQVAIDGYRVHCKLTPRGPTLPQVGISIDANEGANAGAPASSNGRAVLVIGVGTGQVTDGYHYLDVELVHTKIDS